MSKGWRLEDTSSPQVLATQESRPEQGAASPGSQRNSPLGTHFVQSPSFPLFYHRLLERLLGGKDQDVVTGPVSLWDTPGTLVPMALLGDLGSVSFFRLWQK